MGKQRQTKRLEAAVQAIQGRWGAQALQKGARPTAEKSPVPCLPTGLTALDSILTIGGLPLGHVSELIGQPTSGKRTLALHILAHAQGRHPCLYIDLAQTFDPVYAAACRVNLARLAIAAPASPGQALDLACDLAAGGRFGLLIFDSTSELLTEALPPAAAAAVLRRLRQALLRQPTAFLFLTTAAVGQAGLAPASKQLGRLAQAAPAERCAKTGPGANSDLDSELSNSYPPGFALNQEAAVRLLVQRARWQRAGGRIAGYSARVAVLRNRWGRPGQETTLRVTFNGVHLQDE